MGQGHSQRGRCHRRMEPALACVPVSGPGLYRVTCILCRVGLPGRRYGAGVSRYTCASLSERLSPLLHAVPSPHCHRHAIKLDHHHDRPSLGPDWPSISKSIVNALVLIIDACGIYRRGKVPANGNRQKQQKLQHLFRISSHTLVLQKSDTPVTRADGHAAAAHAHGCTRLTPGGVTTIAEPNRNTTHAHKHRTHHVCPDQHPVWNPRGATCIFGLKSQ